MKKANSSDRGSAGGAPKSVDEYLAGVPEPARSTLNRVRATIRSVVPSGDDRGHQLRDAGIQV